MVTEDRSLAQNLSKSRPAAAPRTPRVRPQPEDEYSDSSGGMGGYEYPQWYAPPEEGTYYPGTIYFK